MNKNFLDISSKMLANCKKHWKLIAASVIVGFIISSMFSGSTLKKSDIISSGKMALSSGEKQLKHWTCSMHPQIKLPESGPCPLCGMDLIPVYQDGFDDMDDDSISITLNKTARQLAQIQTSEVQLKEVFNEVRLLGKVNYDETRLSYISAWVSGRIDRLFVDFTGTKVRAGDHLIKIYSPELLATQEEYIQAVKNIKETKNSQLSVIRDTAKTTLTSAREKLRLYGIDQKQIDEIIKRGTPNEHMIINSPTTGTVIHKNGFEGMYVKTGDKIYTIADLSRVWLYLDAYESDIQWLRYGQNVVVEAESYPGEKFYGKIAFIDPFVDEKTRTIKLRVNVDNKNEKLKPGMFVRATIKSVLGEGGKIYEEDLAGKWICPMHPDVIRDAKGPCDICGMDLIKTSEFGFVDKEIRQKKVLVIPKTAPLITGKRAVVYVENMTDKTGVNRYTGKEVTLGPLAGDFYIVLGGLKAGELVVTRGNFKIDSALQIQAKPSMMNPAGYYNEREGDLSGGVGSSIESAGILATSLSYYLAVSSALSSANTHKAGQNMEEFKQEIIKIVETNSLGNKSKGIALEINLLLKKLDIINHDLDALRYQFASVSQVFKDIFDKYEYKEDLKLFLSFCSMAFDGNGAYWLGETEEIKNPYYGKDMLSCGEIKAEYGRKVKKSKPMEGHAGHQM